MRIAHAAALLTTLVLAAARAGPAEETPARVAGAERVRVDLVLIDVVVRDRNDRPVAGLARDDFELLVDRLPARRDDLVSFEEICAELPAAPAGPEAARPAPPDPHLPPETAPAAETAPPRAERRVVVYFDFSQMSLDGRRAALRAAREHLASRLSPEDRVMLLAFKRGLRLVQDFTSEAGLLATRLDELRDEILTLDTDVLEEETNLRDVASKPCDPAGDLCTIRRSAATVYAGQEELRARKSLAALEGLMPALAGLPGRKALVLFTDTLRAEPGVQYTALSRTTPTQVGIDIREELIRLGREANAAGVSFYTAHASGLSDWALSPFRDVRDETVQIGGGHRRDVRSDTIEAVRTGLDSALSLQTTLATETGGRALQRSNDLTGILATAQRDLSCYYLLGYRHEGRGDGARHSLIVRLNPGRDGRARRGLTVRHRPYYVDRSVEERVERLMRSALQAPELFRALPVRAEAFDLAPERGLRRVLLTAEVPLASLSLLPAPGGAGGALLAGRARFEAQVQRDGESACALRHEAPLSRPREGGPSHLVLETACLLAPGRYEMVAAVLDQTTLEVGATRRPLAVAPAAPASDAHLGSLVVWGRRDDALRVAAGAAAMGLPDGSQAGGFVPAPERKLRHGQEALLSFVVCPPQGRGPSPGRPITVRRDLIGDADEPVASFPDLSISDPPDPATGCYQVISAVPPGTLGDGLYRLRLRVDGPFAGSPLDRLEAFLVE